MTFQANSLCRHAQHIGQNFLYQTVDVDNTYYNAYSDRSDAILHCFKDSDSYAINV